MRNRLMLLLLLFVVGLLVISPLPAAAQERVAGPDFGRFSTTPDFAVAREQPAVLRLFERSAADGSIVVDTLVNIPLVLVP